MPALTVRYFAAARAAAGVDSERVELRDGADVADALDEVTRRHGAELTRVLARCSFLLDSVAVHDRAAPLPAGAELDVLPPSPAADGDSPRPRLRPVRASRGRDPSERSGDGDQRGYGPKSVTCNSPGAQRSRYGNQSIQTS